MIRCLLFVALLLTASPALAAPKIDQSGADTLKPRITQSLNAIAASFAQNGITMKQTGNLLVEPADTYYAITTPSISLEMPGGVTRTVGMVAINAIPTDAPDMFKVAVALPTPMLDTAGGKNVGALSIGSQSMNGLWNMNLLMFQQLDATYKDVRDIDQVKNASTVIPDLTVTLKLDPKNNLYSGPLEVVANGANHKDPKNAWTAGNVRLRAMMYDIDLAAVRSAGAPKTTIADFNTALVTFATRMLDRADIFLDEHDVTYQSTINGRPTGGSIKSIAWKASLSKIKSGLADGTIEGAGDGFANADPAAVQYSPTHMGVKGSVQKFPLADIVAAKDASSIQTAMNKAATHVVIDNSSIEAPSYALNVNGDLTASSLSPLGIGKVHVDMSGFDALTTYLSSPAGASAIGLGNASNNLVPLLAVLQLTGKPGKDAKGRETRAYDLETTKDGRMLMNGNDMTEAAQTLAAAAKGAQAQGPLAPTIVAPQKK